MRRVGFIVSLLLALAACSAKAPVSESPPRRVDATDALAESPEKVEPPDPREAALATVVRGLLEEQHLLHRTIDDEVSRTAFAAYLDELDPGKMFLLRADHEALARFAADIDDQLRSGDLALAHEGSARFVARVAVVEKMVAELLAAPLDLSDEEQVELDGKKLAPAASDAELRERWRQRLELEVLERTAPPEPPVRLPAGKPVPGPSSPGTPDAGVPDAGTPAEREAKARADLARSYAGRFARLRAPGPLGAAADLVNAVTAAIDPHTTYLPPADKANFDIQMTGSLEGIGAVLREKDHYIEVAELVPGGASWRQGQLAAGDLILWVAEAGEDPVDVVDMRIDDVVKRVRGPKGTVVRLGVRKPTGEEVTIEITRDVVVIEESYARGAVLTRKGRPPAGYIYLPSFYGGKGRTAAGDVRRLLAALTARKVGGIIIDLRGNGGGLLDDAVEMTGLFIDRGPVVQVQDGDGRRQVLSDDEGGVEYGGQVVVLVDRFSASASEIVAAALQDYRRAVIVGTGPTHGKGTVQTLANLDRATGGRLELGVLKLTVQQFYRVNGASTQLDGVVPDVVLPDPAGHIEAGERELPHAIAASTIDPAPHSDWTGTWRGDVLGPRSAARIGKHAVFTRLAKATALLRARRDDTVFPLARPTWEAERKAQRDAIEAIAPDLTKAPAQLKVDLLEEPPAPPPPPGGKPVDRTTRWRDNLARDPWVEESLLILGDMAGGR